MKNYKQLLKYGNNLSRFYVVAVCFFVLFSLVTLFPMCKGGQTAEAVDGTTQSSSLTLSVSSNFASADFSKALATSQQSKFENDQEGVLVESSEIQLSYYTDHLSGCKIFISSDDENGYLSSENYNIKSISSKISFNDFFNDPQYINMWGLSRGSDYDPSPTSTPTLFAETSEYGGGGWYIHFGAKINYKVPAGTYTKSITFAAVVNPIPYSVTYHKNTASTAVYNMPEQVTGGTTETTIRASETVPQRTDDLAFGGWCTVPATSEDNIGECAGVLIEAGGEIVINQSQMEITPNQFNLYAIWKPSIQTYTTAECRAETTDTAVALWDKRDGNSYTVRYINNECWMTQNLSFKLTSGMTLDAETTNLRGLVDTTGETTVSLGTVQNLSSNIGSQVRTQAPTTEDLSVTGLTEEENGYWYNYCATTAGQICSNTTEETTIDICPANWKIPSNTEWSNLGGKNYVEAFSPVTSGIYNGGNLSPTYGSWWSTSASSDIIRYYLRYNVSYGGLTSGFGYNRGIGASVRCMLDIPSLDDITTMQEMTPEFCSQISEGETKQLADTRDGKEYWVAKLADGNCWMTQNLDLDIPAEGLSAADTDIETDWTPSTAEETGRTAPVATTTGDVPDNNSSARNEDETMSYDPGLYVLKTPVSFQTQGLTTNPADNEYLIDVSEMTDTYDSTAGNLVSGEAISAVDIADNSYDAHYLLGNYYQFNTATAGLGATVITSQGNVANSSICPKGWKLPLAGSDWSNTNGSFQKLIDAYGATNSITLAQSPLYFVAGSNITYHLGGIYGLGYGGDYISRVSGDEAKDIRMTFNPNVVSSNNLTTRYYAGTIRCVVPVQ